MTRWLAVAFLLLGAYAEAGASHSYDKPVPVHWRSVYKRVMERYVRVAAFPPGVVDMVTNLHLHPLHSAFTEIHESLGSLDAPTDLCVYCDPTWPPAARHCVVLNYVPKARRGRNSRPSDSECVVQLREAARGATPTVVLPDFTFPWMGMFGHEVDYCFQMMAAWMRVYRLRDFQGLDLLHGVMFFGSRELYENLGFDDVRSTILPDPMSTEQAISLMLMPRISRLSGEPDAVPYHYYNMRYKSGFGHTPDNDVHRDPSGFASLGWMTGWPDVTLPSSSDGDWQPDHEEFPLYPDDFNLATDLIARNLGLGSLHPSYTQPVATIVVRHDVLTRRFSNLACIIRVLQQHDFEVQVLDFRELTSLKEAVRMLRRSHLMLGAHGSNMDQLIHMCHGTVVIEVLPYGWSTIEFSMLSMVKRITLLHVQVTRPDHVGVCNVNRTDDVFRNYAMEVDPGALHDTLLVARRVLSGTRLFHSGCHHHDDDANLVQRACFEELAMWDESSPECSDVQGHAQHVLSRVGRG